MVKADDSRLDRLFKDYARACPEVDPSANFMPTLWQRIEARASIGSAFARFARTVMATSAALCVLLLLLNLVSTPRTHLLTPTYTDALLADHTAEKTYYTEAVRATAGEGMSAAPQH
jgi:hypothetical protein